MFAIYKRELRSYFSSAIGYAFVAILIAMSAAVFSVTTLLSYTNDISTYFTVMLFILMVTLPMLTMKLFAEERKLKTEQLLLTSPVSIGGMVFAKFLAAFTVFFVTNLLCSVSYLSLFAYSEPEGGIILGNIIAITLVGAAFIAIGMFVSSLTENQLAAAIGTFFFLLVMLAIGMLNSFIPWYPVRFVLDWFSLLSRYTNFTNGFFDFSALFYYISVCFVFLFVTCRVYERRRYGA
ncbi:MAG: ABC transporter permease [Clostridia bacterium]|nr:ABC transporter permease [Clostridia bacterium]